MKLSRFISNKPLLECKVNKINYTTKKIPILLICIIYKNAAENYRLILSVVISITTRVANHATSIARRATDVASRATGVAMSAKKSYVNSFGV